MAKYKCPKGFLISQNEQGDYLPFFIYTREKDIQWEENEIDDNNFINGHTVSLREVNEETIKRYIRTETVDLYHDGWYIKVYNDLTYDAYKRLNFNDLTITDDKVSLYKKVDLPFYSNKFGINIQTTVDVKTNDNSLVFLHSQTEGMESDTMARAKNFTVRVYNQTLEPFTDRSNFKNSAVCIYIHGNIPNV